MVLYKKLLLGGVILLVAGAAYWKFSRIHYGDNKAAGRYYTVRGIKMYVEVYGSGKPLLMIHGNGGNISAFSHTIPYFAKHYMVIAVDSRAHGKTLDPGDSLSFNMMADDFSGLLDAMNIPAAYVLGWSDGGITSLVLAMRHPDKVLKLASTGANLWVDSTTLTQAVLKDFKTHYTETKDKLLTGASKNDYKIFMLDYKQEAIPLSALSAIKCPAFIIGGDHDMILPEHTVNIYRNIPNALLWIVPNSGHATLIEHKNEFNTQVDQFFKRTLPSH